MCVHSWLKKKNQMWLWRDWQCVMSLCVGAGNKVCVCVCVCVGVRLASGLVRFGIMFTFFCVVFFVLYLFFLLITFLLEIPHFCDLMCLSWFCICFWCSTEYGSGSEEAGTLGLCYRLLDISISSRKDGRLEFQSVEILEFQPSNDVHQVSSA